MLSRSRSLGRLSFDIVGHLEPGKVRDLTIPADTGIHGVKSGIRPLNIGQNGAAPRVAPVVDGVLGLHVGLLRNRPANLQLAAAGEGEPASPPVRLLLLVDLIVADRVGAVRKTIDILMLPGSRRSKIAIISNHARIDAILAITEQERRTNVGNTKRKRKNTCSQNEAMDGSTDGLGARSALVEVAEDVAAHDDHGHAEPGEAVGTGDDGPVLGEVGLEEIDLADDEDDGEAAGKEVGGGVEEEELIADSGHDDHNPGDNGHGEEGDDGAGAEDIEDEVAEATDRGSVKHFRRLCGWAFPFWKVEKGFSVLEVLNEGYCPAVGDCKTICRFE